MEFVNGKDESKIGSEKNGRTTSTQESVYLSYTLLCTCCPSWTTREKRGGERERRDGAREAECRSEGGLRQWRVGGS